MSETVLTELERQLLKQLQKQNEINKAFGNRLKMLEDKLEELASMLILQDGD